MSRIFSIFGHSRPWLRFSLIILGICWGYWLSGTWPTNPEVKYEPPSFAELEVTEGTLLFTRRSKSSGGEIELHLGNGQKLVLACNPPNTLPSDCTYQRTNEKQSGMSMKNQLTGKTVVAWWRPEIDVPNGGRVYQLQVGKSLFFNFEEQVDYYIKHYQKGGGRNGFFGFILLLLTGLFIKTALNRKE